MKYEILKYGKRLLRQKAVNVGKVTADIRQLADDMLETMYANQGVGLAAEQIGRTESICVIDTRAAEPANGAAEDTPEMPLVMIDPVITETGKEALSAKEGCLSFPEIFVEVSRPEFCVVEYTDIEGERLTIETSGFLARAVQHEVDHLQGVLLVDKMTMVEKVAVSGRLKRLKKQARAA